MMAQLHRIEADAKRRQAQDGRNAGDSSQDNSSRETLAVARAVLNRYGGLVRWQGQFWRWQAGAYGVLGDDALRASIYRELEERSDKATRNRVSDVLDALRAVALIEDSLDPPCYISTGQSLPAGKISTAGGILNLLTVEIEPTTPDLFTLSAVPVEYDPAATCPAWREFLAAIWPDDLASVCLLQEWMGYLLAGDTDHHKIALIVGPARAGKGTILRVIAGLLGRSNIAAPTLSGLAQPFGLQALIGKQAALISDARLSGRVDQEAIAERLLSISGEDNVGVARKFMADYTGRMQVRFTCATNELPRLHDASGALASRFLLLTLSRSWLGQEDRSLTGELLSELPGILNWAMAGYQQLSEDRAFPTPAAAADALQELEDLGSPTRAFLRDCCVVEAGGEVEYSVLYQAWCDWCRAHGRNHPGTEQSFGRDVRAAAPGVCATQRRRRSRRMRVYVGMRLATADDHDDLLD